MTNNFSISASHSISIGEGGISLSGDLSLGGDRESNGNTSVLSRNSTSSSGFGGVFNRMSDSIGNDSKMQELMGDLSDAADSLDKVSDKLRGEKDSEAFNKVEESIDHLKAAANKLRDNPGDVEAQRDLRSAAIDLKRDIAGLEGEIDDESFDALKDAASEFEDATEVFDTAPFQRNGGLDKLKEAMPDLTEKLGEVTDALENLSGQESSESDGDVDEAAQNLSDATDKLDDIVDDLKGELPASEIREVEEAVDDLKAAAEKLAEDPTDEQAGMDFEAAAKKLKDAVGEMDSDDPAVKDLQDAAEAFEDAADELNVGSDQSDSDLADKLNTAAEKLGEVTDAMENLGEDESGESDVEDAARNLSDSANKLDDLVDDLKGEPPASEIREVEEAVDDLKAAAEKLAEDPTDEQAGMDFEAAAKKLKEAVGNMDSDDPSMKSLQYAADEFEKAADDLNIGSDQSDSELADKLNTASEKLDEVTDNLENFGSSSSSDSRDSSEGSWKVDQENKTIQLDNGYSLSFENKDQTWHLKDAEGNELKVWGDPHCEENDGGKWDFKEDSTFVLDDGTKISVGTKDLGNGTSVSDTLTITKDDQAIEVSGIADNNVQISDVRNNGRELDEATNDGYVFLQENGVDDWTTEDGQVITTNQAMENPKEYEYTA